MVGYGAHEIQNALTANSIVLRITGDDSIVQRTSKGYTASSGTVSSDISKVQWRRLFQGRYPDWRDLDYDGADDIVDHITGGWSGYSSSAESDWISTSASLRWTIWEIARRLDRREQLSIELAVIRRKFPSGYRGAKPVRLDAADTLRLYRARTHYDHRHLVDAINFARASSEIVFYGRIFGKDVLETSSWDLDREGFGLPEEYLKPAKRRYSQCWIHWLVWDVKDDFYTAEAKIMARRQQILTSRGQ